MKKVKLLVTTDGSDHSLKRFMENGLKVDTIIGMDNPADFICKVGDEGDYDSVILGSSGLGGFEQF